MNQEILTSLTSVPRFPDTGIPRRNEQVWDAPAIAVALGGSEARSADGWSRAPCPAHGGTGNNLSLRLTHDGRLITKCWSAGCSRDAILAAIDDALGTTFSDPPLDIGALGPRPAHLGGDDAGDAAVAGNSEDKAEGIRPQAGAAPASASVETENRARVREKLRRILHGTTPVRAGSLAYHYLTDTRKLALPAIPKTLRQHPGLYHGPTGTVTPAMVAVVADYTGKPVALHRIWLDPITTDKAFGTNSRLMLGPCRGGAVHLADSPDSQTLLVAEGIETALAAAHLASVGAEVAVWSAISATGLATLIVPARFRRVVVAADHDANGAGADAAEALAQRLRRHGVKVEIRMPKKPETDWNDVLLARHRTPSTGSTAVSTGVGAAEVFCACVEGGGPSASEGGAA